MYLSRYDFVVFDLNLVILYRGMLFTVFVTDALGIEVEWGKKKVEVEWSRLISAHRACIHNVITFLPPSLWEGLVCLNVTRMLVVRQEKTMQLVYVCVSYTFIGKN